MLRPVISASVREVVTFVLRTGDLGGSGQFSGRDRALEGTRGHQRLQKQRPAGYEPEVRVRWSWEDEEFAFELNGRIDGVMAQNGSLTIEEIKTVRTHLPSSAHPLHWAQARIYACIFACERGYRRALTQVTYLALDSGETISFEDQFTIEELKLFFDGVVNEYIGWLREQQLWRRQRDQSIQALAFPFPEYRPGQRALAVAAYRAIKARGKLFAEAPTGIGKTISVLFPAIKALGDGSAEKIFYATAKTPGRIVAEQTLERLSGAGLQLRRVTLTARDKICFNNGQPCDLTACPFAIGYYDRLKSALRDGLRHQDLNRARIEEIAQKHRVCPFELSLDLSSWVDAIICDYNYVFDPSVSLDRYFDGEKHNYAILVDESHNLIDRAREMFSAELNRGVLLEIKAEIANLPDCAKALDKVCSAFPGILKEEGWSSRDDAFVNQAPPAKFSKTLEKFIDAAEQRLVQDERSPQREPLLNAYFQVLGFKNTLERFDEHFLTIYDPRVERLRLFCADPSKQLRETLHRTGSAVFFSATLRPIEFFRQTLGGELTDAVIQLNSPFPKEKLCVLVQDRISTRLQNRAGSYAAVVDMVAALVSARTGNYLVFFPSYAYLAEVVARFTTAHPQIQVKIQSAGMTEEERDRFLLNFQENGEHTLVGFAVLGGIFGEGIDLVGDRLIGAVIVGVGLPQICLERDLIKERAQQTGAPGFDHAYTFPGINRVLQALGRVIRSENDRGIVLLIDERFRQIPYRNLLPAWWRPHTVRSPAEISAIATKFWFQLPSIESVGIF